MPKLRNGPHDVGMFTQWMARKCANHNPLSELALTQKGRGALPRIYENKKATHGHIMMVADEADDKMVYFAAGRAFMVHVRELPVAEAEALPMKVIQY